MAYRVLVRPLRCLSRWCAAAARVFVRVGGATRYSINWQEGHGVMARCLKDRTEVSGLDDSARESRPADPADLAGYLGPASITWRLAGEAIMLLGGGRAVLMQLAHPLVAAGVGQHSSYRSDPWGRTAKTIELMASLTYGTRAEARTAARTINRLHIGVAGTLATAAGDFARDAPYHARDPELLLWVWATLVDTILQMYPMFVGPLASAETDQYYQESRDSIAMLGLPARYIPPTLDAFRGYMRNMLASGALASTPEALEVARIVMRMPAPLVTRPAFLAAEQLTIGLLPPRVRALYGFTWDARRQKLLEMAAASSRRLLPLLPPLLREVPWARAARRRVRRGPRMDQAS